MASERFKRWAERREKETEELRTKAWLGTATEEEKQTLRDRRPLTARSDMFDPEPASSPGSLKAYMAGKKKEQQEREERRLQDKDRSKVRTQRRLSNARRQQEGYSTQTKKTQERNQRRVNNAKMQREGYGTVERLKNLNKR